MTQGAAEQAAQPHGTSWDAWSAYVLHLQPRAAAPCPVCIGAESPTAGCEEGQRLYGVYRLARLQAGSLVAG